MFNCSVKPSEKVVEALTHVDLVAFGKRWNDEIEKRPTYENFMKLTSELYEEAGFNTKDPEFIKFLDESAKLSVKEAEIQKQFRAFEETWIATLNRLAPELEDS